MSHLQGTYSYFANFFLVQVSNSLRGPAVGAPTIGTLGIYLLIEVPEPFINNPRLEQ
jgi:hypothetical protein